MERARRLAVTKIDEKLQPALNELAKPTSWLADPIIKAELFLLGAAFKSVHFVDRQDVLLIQAGHRPATRLDKKRPSILVHLFESHWRLIIAYYENGLHLAILDSRNRDAVPDDKLEKNLRKALKPKDILYVKISQQSDGIFTSFSALSFVVHSNLFL